MGQALYMIIGSSRLSSLLQTGLPALLRATERWRELWGAVTGGLDEARRQRITGLVRHAGEFYWLSKTLLEHLTAGKDQAALYCQRSRVGQEAPKEWHDVLREFRGS
jgi:hypothetical protein